MTDKTPPAINIVGQSQAQVTMSTAGVASPQLPQGIYGVWALSQDAFINVQQGALSTAPLTIAQGYLIKASVAPVPVIVPANAVIQAVSSSSGTLCYEKIGNY